MKKSALILLLILLVGCNKTALPETNVSVPESSHAESSESVASLPEGVSASEPEGAVPDRSQPIAVELPGTLITADFQYPSELHHQISNIVFDEDSNTWAILYAVSDYDGNEEWRIFHEDNAKLNIQLFDEKGAFLKCIETGMLPFIDEAKIVPSEPCTFKNGMLTFYSGWIITDYVFFDVYAETFTKVSADRCIVEGDFFLMRKENRGDSSFRYRTLQLFERDSLVSEINLPIGDVNLYRGDLQSLSLDANEMLASYGDNNKTFFVDFKTGEWSFERHYKPEYLDWEFAADDRWEISLVELNKAGLSSPIDVVSLEKSTGIITFLTTIDYTQIPL